MRVNILQLRICDRETIVSSNERTSECENEDVCHIRLVLLLDVLIRSHQIQLPSCLGVFKVYRKMRGNVHHDRIDVAAIVRNG